MAAAWELVDGTQDNLVRNAGAVEGQCVPNRGIRILGKNGAVLSGGNATTICPGARDRTVGGQSAFSFVT